MLELNQIRNDQLRLAVRLNLVSFPSQAPVFYRQSRADIQWRMAILYFVRGWSLQHVAQRYAFSRERAGQIVTAWRDIAIVSGYIREASIIAEKQEEPC